MVNLSHPRNRGEGSGRMRAQRQGREDIAMKPRNPIHPGEMLFEELLRPAGASQRQLAAKLGWTAAKLNELVKGRRGVTADSAFDLAKALGTSPEFWMNLQMMWDLRRAEMRRNAPKGVLDVTA